jgi:hypothetical protein
MAGEPHAFKRLVLGLEPSAPDRAIRFAAKLAELLHLELLGLFVEDPRLRDLAAIPFAREFRPLGGGWRSIELDQLTHDLDIAIRNAERTFVEAARDLTTRCQFAVTRAAAAQAFASISRSGDIFVITEPTTLAARATQQFSWLLNAAFQSTAAGVMLVPTRVARTTGPVIVIALAPDDPSIRTAAAIAVAAKETLIIVHGDERKGVYPKARSLAADTDLMIRHVFTGNTSLSDPATYTHVLSNVRERLLVGARSVLAPELALAMASSRRIPVLVIAPSEGSLRPDR